MTPPKERAHWLTIPAVARLVGVAPRRLRKIIQAVEKRDKVKILQDRSTGDRPSYVLTMAKLRRAMPEMFASGEEHLPPAVRECIDDVRTTAQKTAYRASLHTTEIGDLRRRVAALEKRLLILTRAENRATLRLV